LTKIKLNTTFLMFDLPSLKLPSRFMFEFLTLKDSVYGIWKCCVPMSLCFQATEYLNNERQIVFLAEI